MFKLLLAAAAVLTAQTATTTWQVADINSGKNRVLMIDTASRLAMPVKTTEANVPAAVTCAGGA